MMICRPSVRNCCVCVFKCCMRSSLVAHWLACAGSVIHDDDDDDDDDTTKPQLDECYWLSCSRSKAPAV
jgi:hypothetical protein